MESPHVRKLWSLQISAIRLQPPSARNSWFLWTTSAYFCGKCEVRCLEKLEKRRDEDERQDWKRFTKRGVDTGMGMHRDWMLDILRVVGKFA